MTRFELPQTPAALLALVLRGHQARSFAFQSRHGLSGRTPLGLSACGELQRRVELLGRVCKPTWGIGGIKRYFWVLAFSRRGPEKAVSSGIFGAWKGRYCAVLRGIALSRVGPGGGRYCVVLPCPGWGPEGAVLGGIAWYWPFPAMARNRRYWAVFFGIGIFLVSFRVVLAFFGGGRSGGREWGGP